MNKINSIRKNKISLGLPLDSSVNREFEKISRHNNFIFSSGIDFIHEFFNLERKSRNAAISRSVQLLVRNSLINKTLTKIADKGITF